MKSKIPRWQQQSIDRWEEIVADAKRGKIITNLSGQPNVGVYGECGFCKKFCVKNTIISYCGECPLLRQKICFDDSNENFLYWKLCEALIETKGKSNKRIITMCEKILKRVKEVKA
jgi:hypothetical protein